MDILYALEELRTPLGDGLFSILTYLGDQTVCIAAVLLLLWCFDKQKGYCLFLIATTGTAVNQLLKAIFLIPRPWVKDPAFTIVESAREAATGYSFPSGHTQNVTAGSGQSGRGFLGCAPALFCLPAFPGCIWACIRPWMWGFPWRWGC